MINYIPQKTMVNILAHIIFAFHLYLYKGPGCETTSFTRKSWRNQYVITADITQSGWDQKSRQRCNPCEINTLSNVKHGRNLQTNFWNSIKPRSFTPYAVTRPQWGKHIRSVNLNFWNLFLTGMDDIAEMQWFIVYIYIYIYIYMHIPFHMYLCYVCPFIVWWYNSIMMTHSRYINMPIPFHRKLRLYVLCAWALYEPIRSVFFPMARLNGALTHYGLVTSYVIWRNGTNSMILPAPMLASY